MSSEDIPQEVLVRLREEIKQRKQAETELSQLKEEIKIYKEGTEKWKKATMDKYEEAIKKIKAKNYEYVIQVEEWKKNKEREVQEQHAKIAENNELIAKKVEELRQWKQSQGSNIQEIMNTKDKEIKVLTESLKEAKDKIKKIEMEFPMIQLLEDIANDPESLDKKLIRRHTISFENLTKMQDEVMKKSQSPELRSKAEQLQMEIATLVLKQEKMNLLIQHGEEAKRTLEETGKLLQRKRKDLSDVMKDMKSARIVKSKMKQKEEEIENKLNIVKDPIRRKNLLKRIPKQVVAPPSSPVEIACIIGPTDNGKPLSQKHCSGWSASLYPYLKEEGKHQGDPIADRFHARLFKDCAIIALADGCGWGCDSRDAARIASSKFVESMSKVKGDIVTTKQAAKLMLRSFADAHAEIISGRTEDTIFLAGTTTMLGGLVLELASPDKDGRYVFVATTVGDCKAFHYSWKSGVVKDITLGNRQNIDDVRDPGGRIGPQIGKGDPDLRNLLIYSCVCDENDILLVVSDGVHDNLDPQYFGKLPKDFQLESKDNTWNSVHNVKEGEKVKSAWSYKLLKKLIEDALNGDSGKYLTARISETLVNHALSTTMSSRDFMENNKLDQKLPDDYTKFPGKMDHATCVVYQIPGKKTEPKLTKSDSSKRLSV